MNKQQTNSLLDVPSSSLQILSHNTRANESQLLLSLVLPTYKEAKNIPAIVEQITRLLNSVIPGQYELIVVDDNSPDKTWEIAQSIMGEYPQLRVMRRRDERGLSTAVIRGWQVANGEIFGVIDADLQHPPEVLLQMLAIIKEQADVDLVVASRHVEGGGVSDWSLIRRFLSRGAQTLGLIILPGVVGRVSDPMSGYFMVRRQALVGKTMNPLGYKILIETLGRGDIGKVAEVGYVFQERLEGESKVTWKQYVDYLRHLVRLRLDLWRIGRFLRFGIVGFSGVFVDMAVLYLLSDPTTLAWGLTRSKIIAAEAAIVNNFLWNDAWTFADMSIHQRGWKKRFKRFLKFNLVCLGGVGLNIVLLNVMFNLLGFNSFRAGRYVANFIAIAIVTLWNFWLNLKLSWRVTEVDR
ncbi:MULTISPECIES: glycosyltransferase [Planktothricoides]|uniref:Dolichol-phosphate mannosyltransferase n=2 Tax=Planktothricoides raciborskii TaxID=132608 RepID=A0AAU8JAI2_9CYAN|nr:MULTISPECIES: glycosyltransferase [Planktothricoides]KOR35803.1 sulfonate ABC transporter permease [Planktothricoides sp. SR001]MBD2542952.1 glycosyltransferase [Planktothricoides raciborskii FACHB-1370]MBD2581829.1 glycosyltransferase [Planktothricoides raciborskii FACHB-1261]